MDKITKPIYMVKGCTGEYEDRYSWDVCAYYQEELAMIHAKNAQKDANEWDSQRKKTSDQYAYPPENFSIWDGKMHMDSTGTYYDVEPVTLMNIKNKEEFNKYYKEQL